MGHARVGVVMAGGSGERFWPLSTPEKPKQLLNLTDPNKTMLEEALDRLRPIIPEDCLYLSISGSLKQPVLEKCYVPDERVLVEPTRRNTLGAMCWIAANLMAHNQSDAAVAVVTADHKIDDAAKFRECVMAALEVAETKGGIVTIGIPPTRPESGYGYIELDQRNPDKTSNGTLVSLAHAFREKPSPETAEEYVATGHFLWNGGMFFFLVSTFMNELHRVERDAYNITRSMSEAIRAGDARRATELFERLPSISVDYAVMERAETVYTVHGDFGWDDVGAWDAIGRSYEADEDGNVRIGDPVVKECEDCIVFNASTVGQVGVLGVRDLIIVKTDDAVLVCKRNQAQRVRLIVKELQAANRGD